MSHGIIKRGCVVVEIYLKQKYPLLNWVSKRSIFWVNFIMKEPLKGQNWFLLIQRSDVGKFEICFYEAFQSLNIVLAFHAL